MFTTPPFLQEASHLSPLLASRAFLRALTLALDLSADLASTSLSYLDKASFNRFARASGVFVGSPGTGRAGQSIMSFCTWSAAETACSRSRLCCSASDTVLSLPISPASMLGNLSATCFDAISRYF